MLNLRDAYQLLMDAKGDPTAVTNREELLDLLKDVSMAGSEQLKNVDEKDLYTAVSLMLSAVAVDLMGDGEFETAILLLTNPKASLGIMTVCLRLSLGIKEVEGWK